MAWNGRSVKPAEAGAVPVAETPMFVPFVAPFPEVPTVQLPPSPGVTASLGEVTTEGFVLIVERDDETEPAAIEWIATTSTSQED